MRSARITVKAILGDGTRMGKIIWYDTEKDSSKYIMEEFHKFVDNVFLRIPK